MWKTVGSLGFVLESPKISLVQFKWVNMMLKVMKACLQKRIRQSTCIPHQWVRPSLSELVLHVCDSIYLPIQRGA